jgi:hypothetical protein
LAARVVELRREHRPAYHIAQSTGLSPATVSRILQRARLSRWRDLHPAPPVVRYEHPHPGDLLHLDIKGLTRYQEVLLRADGRRRGLHEHPGFEALHVAIDDHSRLSVPRAKTSQFQGGLNSYDYRNSIRPPKLAMLVHHYSEALAPDFGLQPSTSLDWEDLSYQERNRMVAAIRLALLDLRTAPLHGSPCDMLPAPEFSGGSEGKECGS